MHVYYVTWRNPLMDIRILFLEIRYSMIYSCMQILYINTYTTRPCDMMGLPYPDNPP
jgi:hypothetical protein